MSSFCLVPCWESARGAKRSLREVARKPGDLLPPGKRSGELMALPLPGGGAVL